LGSLILAIDAFNLLVPDIYIDTMGYAFTLALSKLLFPKVPTAAYVHYPTISTDMLSSLDAPVSSEQGLHVGAGKGMRGTLKKKYWQLFANAYSIAGVYVDVVMTNSSWTRAHIQELWGTARAKHGLKSRHPPDDISVVFPPVAVSELEEQVEVSAANESSRLPHLLYIAQFRPEKNHTLILTAFAKLLSSQEWSKSKRPRLVFVGSVRDRDDATRVYKLRLLAHELQIKDDVEFVCDASWPQVLDHLGKSTIGVNGMWNEHFGIGVVEYQASGLISVVNDSGGPKMDIVVPVDGGPTGMITHSLTKYVWVTDSTVGFHASTAEQYASAFGKALNLNSDEALAMRLRARESAQRFREEVFSAQWINQMEKLVKLQTGTSR
jgi:alpha-1,2-mannosyltransferase